MFSFNFQTLSSVAKTDYLFPTLKLKKHDSKKVEEGKESFPDFESQSLYPEEKQNGFW